MKTDMSDGDDPITMMVMMMTTTTTTTMMMMMMMVEKVKVECILNLPGGKNESYSPGRKLCQFFFEFKKNK